MSRTRRPRPGLATAIVLCALLVLGGCGGGGGGGGGSGTGVPEPEPAQGGGLSAGGGSGAGDTMPPPPPPPPPDLCIPVHAGSCLSASEFEASASSTAAKYRIPGFRTQWGLERIGADDAYAHIELAHGDGAEPGAGVNLGFIDTGIHMDNQLFKGSSITEVLLGATDEDGSRVSHGTAVASVAAAPRQPGFHEVENANAAHGVAPGSDIVMFAIPLGSAVPGAPYVPVTLARLAERDSVMAGVLGEALAWRDGDGDPVDFLNLSFGYDGIIDGYTEEDLRANFEETIAAAAQAGAGEKTILVAAAGNAHGRNCNPADTPHCVENTVGTTTTTTIDAVSVEVLPGLAARIEELRGHLLAVAAVDRTGEIASFSNRCGIAAEYCLAAPGQDIVAAFYGPAWFNHPDCPDGGCPGFQGITNRTRGTSYAAPMVTGGLALLKQLFRSQLSNPELAARILATADRSGRYADSGVYGQGLLDLDAATSPVGGLDVPVTGVTGNGAPLATTGIRLGAAFGDGLERSLGGREIAALDDLDAPFWFSLGSLASTAPGPSLARDLRELMAPDPVSGPDAGWGLRPAAGGSGPGGAPPGLRLGLLQTPSPRAGGGHLGLAGGALALALAGEHGLSATAFTTAGGHGGPSPAAAGALLAWRPARTALALRAGWMDERESLLGTTADGAFGELATGAVFAGLRAGGDLGGWHLDAAAEVGSASPAARDGIISGVSTIATSAFALRASRPLARSGTLHLSLAQPLRIERGRARLDVPVGRTPAGEVVRSRVTADLAPSGRQLDAAAKWHRRLGGGELRLGAVATREPGHRADAKPRLTVLAGWRRPF